MTSYSKTEYEKYLNILEVNATDSLDTIKSAYRKLVAKYHPDKQTDDVAKELANEKLKMVNQAYEYLCKYYDTYSSGQSTDYENYTQEETTYNSNYSYEDYSEEYQEDNYEYNDNANDNNFENDYDDEYTYDEPYEQEDNYNQQNLYTQNADGCSITITVIVLFIVACIIVAIITSSDNNHDKNISNDQRLNQYSYNKDNNADNTIQEQERKNAENAQRRLEQETQTVAQKLTPEQQTTYFEKNMASHINNAINSNYFPYDNLKSKTFSGIAYCKLNGNYMYKWKYLGGDLDDASGHNMGREMVSVTNGYQIQIREDNSDNYDYKMLIKHTSAGTTVKVLKIYHYTEAEKEMNKKTSFASNQTTQPAIQNTKKTSPQTNKTPTPKINVEKETKENDAYLFE